MLSTSSSGYSALPQRMVLVCLWTEVAVVLCLSHVRLLSASHAIVTSRPPLFYQLETNLERSLPSRGHSTSMSGRCVCPVTATGALPTCMRSTLSSHTFRPLSGLQSQCQDGLQY